MDTNEQNKVSSPIRSENKETFIYSTPKKDYAQKNVYATRNQESEYKMGEKYKDRFGHCIEEERERMSNNELKNSYQDITSQLDQLQTPSNCHLLSSTISNTKLKYKPQGILQKQSTLDVLKTPNSFIPLLLPSSPPMKMGILKERGQKHSQTEDKFQINCPAPSFSKRLFQESSEDEEDENMTREDKSNSIFNPKNELKKDNNRKSNQRFGFNQKMVDPAPNKDNPYLKQQFQEKEEEVQQQQKQQTIEKKQRRSQIHLKTEEMKTVKKTLFYQELTQSPSQQDQKGVFAFKMDVQQNEDNKFIYHPKAQSTNTFTFKQQQQLSYANKQNSPSTFNMRDNFISSINSILTATAKGDLQQQEHKEQITKQSKQKKRIESEFKILEEMNNKNNQIRTFKVILLFYLSLFFSQVTQSVRISQIQKCISLRLLALVIRQKHKEQHISKQVCLSHFGLMEQIY